MSSAPSGQVVSLGCRLNIAESERIRALIAGDPTLVVINSCAVTNEAVRQTRRAIRRARRDHPDGRLLVTGCAAEIEREQIASMPEVDGIVPNASKLDSRNYNARSGADHNLVRASGRPRPTLGRTGTRRTRAFLAIQNGCDHSCTFCIIPQGRGRSRSLTVEQVIAEAEAHLDAGAAEIVLTGVDVTGWGHDLPGKPSLGTLVQTILDRFPDLPRLRMSSLDGIEVDPLLLELFASEDRLMPHLHLSLQHGHDLILKRMKRRHSRDDAVDLVRRLKARRPAIAIGADLIAGFPTETEEMHQANRSIVAELEIVHGHIFPFSPRKGTPAARMPQVDRQTVARRASELREAVGSVRAAWLQRQLGHAYPVLAEKDGTGYSPEFARIAVPDDVAPGEIALVTPRRMEEGLLL